MESNSEVNDIISTNRKRKYDTSDSDSDFDEIVFPLRNRRRILSDDEEECINEDCEINLKSNEWRHRTLRDASQRVTLDRSGTRVGVFFASASG